MLIGPFSSIGIIILRYTFSSTRGTQQIIVGFTVFIASTRIEGDGIRPSSVI